MDVQSVPKTGDTLPAVSMNSTTVSTSDLLTSTMDSLEANGNDIDPKNQGVGLQAADQRTAPLSTLSQSSISAPEMTPNGDAVLTSTNHAHGQGKKDNEDKGDKHDGIGSNSAPKGQSETADASKQVQSNSSVAEQSGVISVEQPLSTQFEQSQQAQQQAELEAAASSSKIGSRFSVNLSGVGLPAMASNLGLTQANSERAADMAQDLKKNVVNMWHAWFPTPPVPSTTTSSSITVPLSEPTGNLRPLASGSQTLSHHHNQQHQQHRPAKTQRMNSYTLGSKVGVTEVLNPLAGQALSSSSSPSRGYSLDISTKRPSSPIPADAQPPRDTVTRVVHEANDPIAARSSTCVPPPLNLNNGPIYLMGKFYPPSPTQWADFQQDFTAGLIWCTYRHSYAPIKPSNFSTDVGWGCMLRSGQGLLANALAIQFMGRGWNRPVPGDANWASYVRIISWFFDDMNARSPFSVHRIALLGKQLGKNIGEWFGPSTTSQVTKALVHNFPDSGLNVYVTTDGVVYKDEVEEAATMKKKEFSNLLILVTIRLGIDKLNPIYNDAIKATFEFPQSLGIAGGRPSSSYYFVGHQGDDLFYLDPHHSRCVVETKDLKEYTAEDLATYHCETIRKIDINAIDPSMLLAFYCRDRTEFDAFCVRVRELNARPGMGSSIFTIGEKAPVYADDESQLLSVADEEDDDLELIL
ncbi:Cysteine protease atg4 [Mortierella sp. GBA30]|nr:Cysteine protease atg4 [Mortierella sp. GBA30]